MCNGIQGRISGVVIVHPIASSKSSVSAEHPWMIFDCLKWRFRNNKVFIFEVEGFICMQSSYDRSSEADLLRIPLFVVMAFGSWSSSRCHQRFHEMEQVHAS